MTASLATSDSIGSNSDRSITWPRPAPLDHAERRQRGEAAVDAGDHVGQRQRRQQGRAVGEAVEMGIARHRLDQRAEARMVAPRPVLSPAGDAQDHQSRVDGVQLVRAEAPFLQRARNEVLDQHLGAGDQRRKMPRPSLRMSSAIERLLRA